MEKYWKKGVAGIVAIALVAGCGVMSGKMRANEDGEEFEETVETVSEEIVIEEPAPEPEPAVEAPAPEAAPAATEEAPAEETVAEETSKEEVLEAETSETAEKPEEEKEEKSETYEVHISVSEGGSASVSGAAQGTVKGSSSFTVNKGAALQITVTAEEGYELESVTGAAGAGNSYSVTAEGETNVDVSFKKAAEAKKEAEEQPKKEEVKKEEPAKDAKKEPEAEHSVTIHYEIVGGEYKGYGTQVVLVADLSGFAADESITYKWQTNDGSGWSDIAGASGATYTLVLDENNINNQWRLAVESN